MTTVGGRQITLLYIMCIIESPSRLVLMRSARGLCLPGVRRGRRLEPVEPVGTSRGPDHVLAGHRVALAPRGYRPDARASSARGTKPFSRLSNED